MKEEHQLLVLLATGAIAAFKVLETILKKIRNKPKHEVLLEALTEDVKKNKEILIKLSTTLDKLDKSHSILDNNGVPMWYMPREICTLLKEVQGAVGDIAQTQGKLVYIHELMANSKKTNTL